MKIPADALIPKAKLTDYLLKKREEDDKSKFLAQGGFTVENTNDLEIAIRQLVKTNDAVKDRTDQYGDYYRVEGDLIGTNGRNLGVVTIWIIQASFDSKFRFVTLKPKRKARNET